MKDKTGHGKKKEECCSLCLELAASELLWSMSWASPVVLSL